MVKLTLIGPPEEVAAMVESMKKAVRVEVTGRRESRYSATDARWYAVAEQWSEAAAAADSAGQEPES